MPQLVKKRRSGWAVLAAGALVASLLAVGAAPAAAIDEDSKQNYPTKSTACLGPASADAGFTDLGGLDAAVADINCLAYYGITTGKTADTFDPNSNVTRSQMALFLYRAAGKMGVDLMGGDMMVDYGDIDMLGEDRQVAIKALARNGIFMGRNSMAFYPGEDITRAEMAVALVSLLDKTPGVPLAKGTTGASKGLFVHGPTAPGNLPNDNFSDAYASVSQPVNNAISAAYEMGITTGRPAGSDTFAPHDSVPRRNMATFITRALAHSNLRPAGLTAQVDGTTVTVSIRDAAFAPVVNQTIDAFKAGVANESKAFKDDGTCSSRTTAFEGNPTKCQIDGADPVTQTNGNVKLTLGGDVGDGQTVWIWQGELNDKVSSTTDLVEVSIEEGATVPPRPTAAVISTDLPNQPIALTPTDVPRAHFGNTVTVTIQLQGNEGNDTSAPLVNTVPEAGSNPLKYRVVKVTFNGDSTAADDRLLQSSEEVTVGSDGSASFTVTARDTDENNRGQRATVQYTVTAMTGTDLGTAPAAAVSPGTVIFSDEAPVVTYVTVKGSGPKVAPGTSGVAGNRVTVTLQDQFGAPISGSVVLHSSNPTGDGDTIGSTIRTTALNAGPSGTVTIGYSHTGGASRETLKAAWDGYVPAKDLDGDGSFDGEGESDEVGDAGVESDVTDCIAPGLTNAGTSTGETEDRCGTTTVDWVQPTTAAAQGAVNILSIDVDDDQIVVDLADGAVTPTSVNYDDNDFFTVTNDAGSSPAGIADFEAAIVADLKAAAATTVEDQPTLLWGSHVYDDPGDIATFTFAAGGGR